MNRVESYVTRQGLELTIHVNVSDELPSHAAGRPAVMFFHGGGWRNGVPEQFKPFAQQLTEMGWFTGLVQYRLLGKTASSVQDCVDDALAAWDWLHSQAARFAIDPRRCCCSGGSAGGHLAIMVAVESHRTLRPIPAQLLLFNPVVSTDSPRFSEDFKYLPQLNPMRRLTPALPPMTVLHGQNDEIVLLSEVETFTNAVRATGTQIDLHVYPDQTHGFFNLGRASEQLYADINQKVASWASRIILSRE